MGRYFHVSSARNRDSIAAHGLDCSRMGAAPGIAGSPVPEQAGVFVCRDRSEAEYFAELNNTGGPVDIWSVDGVEEARLRTSREGYQYLPCAIPADRVALVGSRAEPPPEPVRPDGYTRPGGGSAYRSTLTITLADGTVLHDADALER